MSACERRKESACLRYFYRIWLHVFLAAIYVKNKMWWLLLRTHFKIGSILFAVKTRTGTHSHTHTNGAERWQYEVRYYISTRKYFQTSLNDSLLLSRRALCSWQTFVVVLISPVSTLILIPTQWSAICIPHPFKLLGLLYSCFFFIVESL